MMKITKRVGNLEVITEADTVGEMRLLLDKEDPRKPLFRCLSCGLMFDNDGRTGCPNAHNHVTTERPYEMNVETTRRGLQEIIDTSKSDTEFERRLTTFLEDNIFENGGENPLENYETVDRLRELLDKYGVEAEDILVAYRKDIEKEQAEKEKAKQ
jgi:hypothetical protein